MNTLAKLKRYFELNRILYEVILHEEVYSAQELAQALHTSGKNLIKVVIVKADGFYRMAVLAASRRIDLPALKAYIKSKTICFATEREIKDLFPEAEVGAMPPFGNLYNLEVWVDAGLKDEEYITFNAGTHYEAVRMLYADFERLVRPCVASFSAPV